MRSGRRHPAAIQAGDRAPDADREWRAEDLAVPSFTGARQVEIQIEELVDYIDWTFFFSAWELKGRFPQIHKITRSTARLRAGSSPMRKGSSRRWRPNTFRSLPRGVYGSGRRSPKATNRGPAQRRRVPDAQTPRWTRSRTRNPANLADFVAPAGSGMDDHVGAFAVAAFRGPDDLAKRFEAEHDDYRAIMVKALADRIAEASAGGCTSARGSIGAADPASVERGADRRGFPRHPAGPASATRPADHSLKRRLFDLLDAHASGLDLTESFAMVPVSSVSGLYLAHPQARYFNVGRIGKDQVDDYARRLGESVTEAELVAPVRTSP
ncbi:MAG: vitamin B12 dependent-methionine synthase activation domain-containing protein [Actinomycetota bacterium]